MGFGSQCHHLSHPSSSLDLEVMACHNDLLKGFAIVEDDCILSFVADRLLEEAGELQDMD
jgi:hypothetical protein